MALLPERHRLAAQPELRLEQLGEESFACLEEESLVHGLLLSACERAGFAPKVAFTCREAASIKQLVAKGLCIAVLTRGQAFSEPSLLVKNMSPTAATRIVLCWKKDRRLSPAARAFIDYVNKA